MSSPLGRLRSIAHKVRDRLGAAEGGKPGGGAADGRFGPHNDKAFAVLAEEADGCFQRVGASLVGAWEVGITDLARALEPRLPSAEKARLTERLSDALVPTQQPLQDGKKRFASAVQQGAREGLQSGRLADALRAPVASLQGLGAEMAQGWQKTTTYLGPLFEALPEPELAQRFATVGPTLQALLDEEGQRFADAVQQLEHKGDLEAGLRLAIEDWYQKVSVGLEIRVYEGRNHLVKAAEKLPRR